MPEKQQGGWTEYCTTMKFKSINPATEEVIAEYDLMTGENALSIAKNSHDAFNKWKLSILVKGAFISGSLQQY